MDLIRPILIGAAALLLSACVHAVEDSPAPSTVSPYAASIWQTAYPDHASCVSARRQYWYQEAAEEMCRETKHGHDAPPGYYGQVACRKRIFGWKSKYQWASFWKLDQIAHDCEITHGGKYPYVMVAK